MVSVRDQFAHDVCVGGEFGEGIPARLVEVRHRVVFDGHRARLAVVEFAVVVEVEVDRDVGHARLAVVTLAVAVEVVPLAAVDLAGGRLVAEVHPAQDLARVQCNRMERWLKL